MKKNTQSNQVVVNPNMWEIVKRRLDGSDCQEDLKRMGFTQIAAKKADHCYKALPPKNWTKTQEGAWTKMYDNRGLLRITMYDGGSQNAFVTTN